jgi:hypothetical protein
METAASFEARKAPSPYPTILGEAMETSASFEARSAPLPYPTTAAGMLEVWVLNDTPMTDGVRWGEFST